MLHITLGPVRPADRDDALGRDRVGFDDSMTDQELYEANRGCWVLGARADDETHALLSYGGTVRQAIAIDQIVFIPSRNRRAMEGRILRPGDPVHDRYVGQPSPVIGVRNPITYFDEDLRTCGCDCGSELTTKAEFIAGHDQRAIHARIAKVGSVKDFLAWFDRAWTDAAG